MPHEKDNLDKSPEVRWFGKCRETKYFGMAEAYCIIEDWWDKNEENHKDPWALPWASMGNHQRILNFRGGPLDFHLWQMIRWIVVIMVEEGGLGKVSNRYKGY